MKDALDSYACGHPSMAQNVVLNLDTPIAIVDVLNRADNQDVAALI